MCTTIENIHELLYIVLYIFNLYMQVYLKM